MHRKMRNYFKLQTCICKVPAESVSPGCAQSSRFHRLWRRCPFWEPHSDSVSLFPAPQNTAWFIMNSILQIRSQAQSCADWALEVAIWENDAPEPHVSGSHSAPFMVLLLGPKTIFRLLQTHFYLLLFSLSYPQIQTSVTLPEPHTGPACGSHYTWWKSDGVQDDLRDKSIWIVIIDRTLQAKVLNKVVCVQSPGNHHQWCSSRLYIRQKAVIRHRVLLSGWRRRFLINHHLQNRVSP